MGDEYILSFDENIFALANMTYQTKPNEPSNEWCIPDGHSTNVAPITAELRDSMEVSGHRIAGY